jgi:nucleotide-binding universal stress UspA family protein
VPTDESQKPRRRARATFEPDWCAPLAKGRLPYRTLFADGNPVSILMKVGLQERADTIVVGARGLGGFAELLLGSVSHQLAHHASVPLVVVPSPPKELSREERETYMAAARWVSFSDT